ncbi:MAG: protein jag [Candidatus Polarisedimenticolia bacterium]
MDRPREIEALTRTFLEAMNLSLEIQVTEHEDRFLVELSGTDAYLMRERQGSVLEALQLILGKVSEVKLGLEKRLVVDCDGFKQGRDQELIDLALSAAEKVRKSGQPVELSPMNPYERRIVHVALTSEPGVATESQGDGFIKRILITPA